MTGNVGKDWLSGINDSVNCANDLTFFFLINFHCFDKLLSEHVC